jgi:hypothetical protein
MRFRKLRIAWSVGCAIACVLMIVLWVRSNSYCDSWTRTGTGIPKRIDLQSWRGRILLLVHPSQAPPSRDELHKWILRTTPSAEWEERVEAAARLGDLVSPPKVISLTTTQGAWQIWATDWLLLLLSATIAFIPWIRILPWPKRFSLRTLLIATTLVAVALGLVIYAARN